MHAKIGGGVRNTLHSLIITLQEMFSAKLPNKQAHASSVRWQFATEHVPGTVIFVHGRNLSGVALF